MYKFYFYKNICNNLLLLTACRYIYFFKIKFLFQVESSSQFHIRTQEFTISGHHFPIPWSMSCHTYKISFRVSLINSWTVFRRNRKYSYINSTTQGKQIHYGTLSARYEHSHWSVENVSKRAKKWINKFCLRNYM